MKTSAYTPFEVGTRDRIVGFFVIGALLLFLVGFLIPVIHKLQADKRIPFYTILDQTYGIARDATVSLRGVIIGNVANVGITQEGMVRVDIMLSDEYQDFYTKRSRLTVNSDIGVSTILTGSGLVLHPASPGNGVMSPGDLIVTDAPQGIGSLLEQLDVAELTDQVTEIVANVEGLTHGLNTNQEKLYRSLDNLERVTNSLAEVSDTLPGLVKEVNTSLVALRKTMGSVDTLLDHTDDNLKSTLANAVVLTDQATKTLAEAQTMFHATTPVMAQLPTVMTTTDIALQSITDLTNQLQRSWLLGGGGGKQEPAVYEPGPAAHPHDDGLYELKNDNP
ncbi:MAG: hypothetical protein KDI19_10375 [Pseudomonadales bacterium]|nr:hypothetical protein [Pseudomonadales bacterium]